jgi:CMP-N-acetylneuraminic acid synthetase
VKSSIPKLFLIIKNGSERVSKKNFQLLSDLPLYEYYLNQRNNFDIYIDTDSDEIFSRMNNEEKFSHITCYKRDLSHIDMEESGNESPAPLMIKRFLDEYVNDDNEFVITSHITSPFVKDETILKALNQTKNYESISSVESIKEFAVLRQKDGTETPINFSYHKLVKTQSLDELLILNGAFFILNKKKFLNNGLKRISDNHLYFTIDNEEALDIDLPYQLNLAQLISKQKDINRSKE